MGLLKGIDVTLYDKVKTGTDGFDHPIYEEVPTVFHNILVQPTESSDVIDTLNLTGKKAVYTLAIPKGDAHEWKNRKVSFFGKTFQTFGEPVEGIESMIPLGWNKKVKVEIYEQG